MNKDILSLINRRERQILVHACCYYRFNENLISDYQYDAWGLELIDLMEKYPLEFKASEYYDEFIRYCDGGTPSAFNLHYTLPNIQNRAGHLINLYRKGE